MKGSFNKDLRIQHSINGIIGIMSDKFDYKR